MLFILEDIDEEIKYNDFDCLGEANKLLVSTIWGVLFVIKNGRKNSVMKQTVNGAKQ
ncbi:hypothetical protein [Escherichia coli]|uniref:hypothetical protein n=1 Tax=Escherichia coli TaxID=562 RepID=UPI0038D44B30